ncbi:MAG TPA: hypothetical protein VEL75_23050 [Candidatus Methylomirabilis sp.]|nr:hypothetical protein [Candidatus Methylomirabilis sp.]
MRTSRATRALAAAGLGAALLLAPRAVSTAPPDAPRAELQGACYCRVTGALQCVGVTSKVECDKRCAEALCDDWFWLERLTCWNWGYGG